MLRYYDTVDEVLDAIIERVKRLHEICEDEITKRAFKFVINVLNEQRRSIYFSMLCKRLFREAKIGITDLDKILVADGRIKALFEMKFRNEDFNGRIFANAFQFITLKDLAFKSNLPLYYVYEIGEYKQRCFRILKVNKHLGYDVKKLGNGHSRDSYAIFKAEDSCLLNESEFKNWLREVINGAK